MNNTFPSISLVYGPVQSRRLGASLGVNPLSETEKLCSFNCPYCDLGPSQVRMNRIKKETSFPSAQVLDQRLRERLRELNKSEVRIDAICISGNGEPTLNPELPEFIEKLSAIRHELAPSAKTAILTNGAHIDNRRLAQSLDLLDERMVKLDAGNDRVFKDINAPIVRANPARVIANCKSLKNVIIQSLFVTGSVTNIGDDDVAEWIEVVGMIAPKEVHITTMNRPAWTDTVRPAEEDTLYAIAMKLKRRTGIEVKVFT